MLLDRRGSSVSLAEAPEVARALLKRGPARRDPQAGRERGLISRTRSGGRHFPGFEVKAVDATAAGDTFAGALGVALAEGRSDRRGHPRSRTPQPRCRSRASARRPRCPTRREVEALLASRTPLMRCPAMRKGPCLCGALVSRSPRSSPSPRRRRARSRRSTTTSPSCASARGGRARRRPAARASPSSRPAGPRHDLDRRRRRTAPSFGWINRELVASGELLPHINAYGGEDRFWLGPEGGQFSIFFAKGDPFDLAHWQTPAPSTPSPSTVAAADAAPASLFEQEDALANYSRHALRARASSATVRLARARRGGEGARRPAAGRACSSSPSSPRTASPTPARRAWTKETGLLSIWILGMFKPTPADHGRRSPSSQGPDAELGPDRERRLLRQGARRPPARRSTGVRLLQGRRPAPQQDRPLAAARDRPRSAATTPRAAC